MPIVLIVLCCPRVRFATFQDLLEHDPEIEVLCEDQDLPEEESNDDVEPKIVSEFRQLRIGSVTFDEANDETDLLLLNQSGLRILTYAGPLSA